MVSVWRSYWLSWCFTYWICIFNPSTGINNNCPIPCTCKWRSGKQTVECIKRGLIALPDGVDPETQVLDLSSNNLQILTAETFYNNGLTNLQRLFLKDCRLTDIDNLAFKGLTNLIELDISHNLLTSIPSSAFHEIRFLRDLILSHNPIQRINRRAFKAIPMLLKLDLSKCQIQMITPRAFEGVENLESLKLNGNQLTEFRPQTVETLSRLHGIELFDNPWHCDCRLRTVKEWLVYNNIPYTVDPACSGGPERVIHKTFSELEINDFACKPEILPVNQYIEVASGENATLMCRINAIPPAHVSWYWNGRMLNNHSAFSFHQKIYILEEGKQEKRSTLILTNVQVIDSGDFYCVAENKAGNVEANFTLHVVAKNRIMILEKSYIAGLSAALVSLITIISIVISILLIRLKKTSLPEVKDDELQSPVITIVNGKPSLPLPDSLNRDVRQARDLNLCNPIEKPPRSVQIYYNTSNNSEGNSVVNSSYLSPSSASSNNPDLVNDTKALEDPDPAASYESFDPNNIIKRPNSGDYSRNTDLVYPSSLWESIDPNSNPGFQFDDVTPKKCDHFVVESKASNSYSMDYPPDYGLPIVMKPNPSTVSSLQASQVTLPTNAKTLRIWQKGGVPVLPPVTALKRVLINRNSPDEGYQEGSGTEV